MSIKNLKRTIPFKWRVQSAIPKANPTHVQMIAYVDARDVAEHLDTIIGAENWQDKYHEVKGVLFCELGIKVDNEWIWKSDCGTPSKTEKEKGESSDAFKRAAVKWGINRDAYRVGMIKLNCKNYGGQNYPCDINGKFLKGEELYKICNDLAKVDELEYFDFDESDFIDLRTELEKEFEKAEEHLSEKICKDIKRILSNEEVQSYQKALTTLKTL